MATSIQLKHFFFLLLMLFVGLYTTTFRKSLNIRLVKRVILNKTDGYLYNNKKDRPLYNSGDLNKKKTTQTKTLYPCTVSGPYKIGSPDLCRNVKKVSCLVIVHTAPSHTWRRNEMRRTWLNKANYSPENIVVVFLLGTTDNKTQQAIDNESKINGDIVQGHFVDSYQNLTHKGVLGYRWITENCQNAEFVLKIDDDALVDMFKLFEKFSFLKNRNKLIFCNAIGPHSMLIVRDKASKWYVRKNQFLGHVTYPHAYCSGFVVFLSTDLIPLLYRAAFSTPFFWVDDVYLFGILPSKVRNLTRVAFGGNLTFHHPEALKCYQKKRRSCKFLVMPARDKEISILWKVITSDRMRSRYGNYYLS